MNEQKPTPTQLAPALNILAGLERQLVDIDLLPDSLVPAVATLPGGDLSARCMTIALLRNQLLAGESLSQPCPWLPEAVQQNIVNVISRSGIATYCQNNPQVTDALILDLLSALEGAQTRALILARQLAQIKYKQALEVLKEEFAAIQIKRNSAKLKNSLVLSDAKKLECQLQAELEAWLQLINVSGQHPFVLPSVWAERLEVWQILSEIFDDLGVVTGLGWDLSKGMLQSHGWMNMVRLQKLVEQIPQLREVIETLGRMKDCDGEPVIEEIISKMSVTKRRDKEISMPLVPMETKGITRSDSISRMLPQEAAFLGHPVLKKLWHARRAEHALLSYAVEGTDVITEEVTFEQEVKEEKSGFKINRNRGPMIVCLDTSGSMQGTPENVAKALVLQCISVAKTEKRACYVYLFGSRGEVTEMELTPDAEGLERMILFLSMSFGGGTDAEGPLNLALERSDKNKWHQADILLVSDGEFAVSSGLTRKISHRKDNSGLSIHGIVIGSSLSPMDKICDPLHQFSSWLDLQNNVYQ